MKIFLRPVTLKDGKNIVRWRNSKEVTKHCLDKRTVTLDSNENFFHAFVETGKYKQFIVERMEEQSGVASYPIATVYLKDIDRINQRCELCIFTSDDEEWNTDSQSIAIKMLLEKAFTEFDMHKVYTYVFEKNNDEIELMKRSGFSEEAVLEQEAIDEGDSFTDLIRLSIIKKINEI